MNNSRGYTDHIRIRDLLHLFDKERGKVPDWVLHEYEKARLILTPTYVILRTGNAPQRAELDDVLIKKEGEPPYITEAEMFTNEE